MREIIIVIVGVLILGTPLTYFGIHSDKIVENYCANVYQHSVTGYKACRNLTQTELIEKLTKDFNKKNGIPDLEEIK